MLKYLASALIALVASMGEPAWAARSGKALIVGINAYPALNSDGQLLGSVADAETMQKLATTVWGLAPEDVLVLTNEQATRRAILDAIDDVLVKGSKAGDLVILSFSGHGYHVADLDGDEAADFAQRHSEPMPSPYWRDEALVPHDVTVTGDPNSPFGNLIIDDELHDRLQRIPDRQVMVFVDSCFSGTITRSLQANTLRSRVLTLAKAGKPEPPKSRAAPMPAGPLLAASLPDMAGLTLGLPHVTAWMAASASELAYEDDHEPRGGAFTKALARGLMGAADQSGDGLISHGEMLAHVRKEVRAFCNSKRGSCLSQSPSLEIGTATTLVADMRTFKQPDTVQQAVASTLVSATETPVAVALLPGPTLREGAKLRVQITSPVSGTLRLFSIDTQGTVTRLFPNLYSQRQGQSDRIEAASAMQWPLVGQRPELKVSGPPGPAQIIALVVSDPIDLARLDQVGVPSGGVLATIADPVAHFSQFATALNRLWLEPPAAGASKDLDIVQRPTRWALGRASFTVVP